MSKLNEINAQITRYRWTICGLIFFATTINYLDRNVLGLLKPVLTKEGVFGTDKAAIEDNYANVVIAFQLAYAIGMFFAGRFIDWVGTKAGYAYSLIGWSLAAIGHAFGHHTWSFGLWRALLGFTEAGNFPAANKTVAEWFPKKERAFATGLYNSGANVGAIIAPLCVPWIAATWGWEWAFVITGVIGFFWLFFWYRLYDSPAEKLKNGTINQAEYDFIHSDKDEAVAVAGAPVKKAGWGKLLGFRQTWAFALGKMMTDGIWWFFLFWLPAFLAGENERKVAIFKAANPTYTGNDADIDGIISWPLAVAVVYCVATVGSILGGWFPKKLMNSGMDANKARKLAMFIFALFPLSVLAASRLGEINTWYAVGTIAIACAAHQAWSANIFTTVSDMFPKYAVASVTGIGGMAGALGGLAVAKSAGLLLSHYTSLGKIEQGYAILFIMCGVAYIAAWFVMHLLVPKFSIVKLDDDSTDQGSRSFR